MLIHGHHGPTFPAMVTCLPLLTSPHMRRSTSALLKITQPHNHRNPAGKGQTLSLQEEFENWGYPSWPSSFPPAADWRNTTTPGKTRRWLADMPEQQLYCSQQLARKVWPWAVLGESFSVVLLTCSVLDGKGWKGTHVYWAPTVPVFVRDLGPHLESGHGNFLA